MSNAPSLSFLDKLPGAVPPREPAAPAPKPPAPAPKLEDSRIFRTFLLIGVFMVLVGLANVSAHTVSWFGDKAITAAFGPAILALEPDLLERVSPRGASIDPIVPARISIPSIDVTAPVEMVAQKSDGSMATPSSFFSVGWYKLGPKPGANGNAVFAGHVNNALGMNGVFANLERVKLGDRIEVADASGRVLAYEVVSREVYPTASAPIRDIFSTAGSSQLVLITCEGDWISSARSYDHRLVLVAKRTP